MAGPNSWRLAGLMILGGLSGCSAPSATPLASVTNEPTPVAESRSLLEMTDPAALAAPGAWRGPPSGPLPADWRQVHNELYRRTSDDAQAYAARIGLGQAWFEYCWYRVDLDHQRESREANGNGSIPYGQNYNQMRDWSVVTPTITARESLERGNLIMCLAQVKNALEAATR